MPRVSLPNCIASETPLQTLPDGLPHGHRRRRRRRRAGWRKKQQEKKLDRLDSASLRPEVAVSGVDVSKNTCGPGSDAASKRLSGRLVQQPMGLDSAVRDPSSLLSHAAAAAAVIVARIVSCQCTSCCPVTMCGFMLCFVHLLPLYLLHLSSEWHRNGLLRADVLQINFNYCSTHAQSSYSRLVSPRGH